MVKTIRISKELKHELNKRKFSDKDTYEEVIWDILEDTMELSEETKKEIEESRKEIERGEFYTIEQVKKELGIKDV